MKRKESAKPEPSPIDDLEQRWQDDVKADRFDSFDLEGSLLSPLEEASWKILAKAGMTKAKLRKAAQKIFPGALFDDGALILVAQKEAVLRMKASREVTKEWYAGQWLAFLRDLRQHRDHDEYALSTAFQLGAIVREAQVRFPLEPLITSAVRQKERAIASGRKGGKIRAEVYAERRDEIKVEAARLKPADPKGWAKTLARLYGLTPGRIRVIVNSHK